MTGLFDHERITEVETPDVPELPRLPGRPAPREEPEPVVADDVAAPAAPPPAAPDGEVEAPAEQPEREHAGGSFGVPEGYSVLEGAPRGEGRAVAVAVSRFNGEITQPMLDRALAALEEAGVERTSVTVVPVPGAFELPLAAMALARTRRYACVVALGCVIRGETSHFDFVAAEAASGIQLAGIETGVPVAFGVLTTDTAEQAGARVARAADAVRSALEMADLFAQLRARSAAAG